MKFLVVLAFIFSNEASAQTKFVEKSFIEFVTGRVPKKEELRELPLFVEIPESFAVRANIPKVEGALIGDPGDIVRVTEVSDYSITENGIFRAAVSTSTAYFSDKDKFSGEDDPPENMEKYGLRNVKVKRLNGPVPMLLTVAEKVDGRRTFLLNVAIAAPARTTMKIFFYQSRHPGLLDEEIVARFVARLSKGEHQ